MGIRRVVRTRRAHLFVRVDDRLGRNGTGGSSASLLALPLSGTGGSSARCLAPHSSGTGGSSARLLALLSSSTGGPRAL